MYWKKIHLPRDIEERRIIITELEGKEVIVEDSVEKKGYGLQGRIALSERGCGGNFYFLRNTERSIPLRYSELRGLHVSVEFSRLEGDLEQATLPEQPLSF